MIGLTYQILFPVQIEIIVVAHSKKPNSTTSFKRRSLNLSIQADTGAIRYEFKMKNVARVIYIPANTNSAYIGTNFDSSPKPVVNDAISNCTLLFLPGHTGLGTSGLLRW